MHVEVKDAQRLNLDVLTATLLDEEVLSTNLQQPNQRTLRREHIQPLQPPAGTDA